MLRTRKIVHVDMGVLQLDTIFGDGHLAKERDFVVETAAGPDVSLLDQIGGDEARSVVGEGAPRPIVRMAYGLTVETHCEWNVARQGPRPYGLRELSLVRLLPHRDRLLLDVVAVDPREPIPVAAERFPKWVEFRIDRVASDAACPVLAGKRRQCLGRSWAGGHEKDQEHTDLQPRNPT